MDNSSDESFAWTNASNSSESSIENPKMTKHNGTLNGIEDDSDYGISYKKKLHKKLLVNNDADDNSHQEHNGEKKGKRKRMDDNIESPKKKKIKLEPESGTDTPKKKKKKSLDHSQSNDTYEESNEDMSQDHSDLNITVKQEPGLMSPPHKSKKQRKSEINECKHSYNDIDKKNTFNETHDTICTIENDESYTSKKKKKKSKKKQSSLSDDNDVSTEVKSNKDVDSYSQHEEAEQVQDIKTSIVKNSSIVHKVEATSEHENNSDNKSELSNEDEPSNTSNLKLKSNNKSRNSINDFPDKPNKRVSSISDRLKLENDNSQMDYSVNNENEKKNSRKLKKFLKINENLKPVSNRRYGDWVLSPDDEVWTIKCPHNIDINAFLGVNIRLDRKCKIKVEGQTYEGTMNDATDFLTVLSLENSNFIIKKLPLNGTLHLRKKIPKVHIQENNVIPDNQLDFVPLPVTKNRHPLFGSNYKKAMKVPSAIAQRLKDPYNDTICENEIKKSKKKKHKNKAMDVDNEQLEEQQETVPENDESLVKTIKKNRKRKHDTDSEHSNTKRAKHNVDSTTVWESEQAIEENLFNF